jgi:hypothetical protein
MYDQQSNSFKTENELKKTFNKKIWNVGLRIQQL